MNDHALHRATRHALGCVLMLFAVSTAHAAAPVRGGDDSVPLEYSTVAEFVTQLPQRRDVVRSPLATPPGMTLLQTSADTVAADPDYAVTSWLLFTAPHALAPSVVRMRTEVTWQRDAPLTRSRRLATLCEAGAAACAALETQSKRLAAAPL